MEKNNKSLKMAGIIVSGCLGIITIIGLYWGKEGLENLGVSLGILGVLTFFIGMLAWSKSY